MITWLTIASMLLSNVSLTEMRSLFQKAAEDEEVNERLLKLSDGYTMDYAPVVFAYHAAANMTMANHAFWPTAKLSYFNDGKADLEKVIKKYPTSVEIRYIRYAVQKGAPSFLNYSANQEEDKRFIKMHIGESDWPPGFRKDVLSFIN